MNLENEQIKDCNSIAMIVMFHGNINTIKFLPSLTCSAGTANSCLACISSTRNYIGNSCPCSNYYLEFNPKSYYC